MLTKKSNRDKNYVAQGHDYLSNHLWVSLLTIRYRDLSSDTLSNFTKKERCQIQIPCVWLFFSTSFCHFLIKRWSLSLKFQWIIFPKRLLSYDCIIISQFRDGPGPTFKKKIGTGIGIGITKNAGIFKFGTGTGSLF